MKLQMLSVLIFFFHCTENVKGHARLLEPPSRSSMFRFAYSDPMLIPYRDTIQPNYEDNQLNCGGKQVQTDNEGKCGVCGDSYTAPVKQNEAGGKYALGIITRNYKQGQIIDATVEVTAEHKGYFEFRLCEWNNVNLPITHECLNKHLLSYENGETKWYLPEDPAAAKGMHNFRVKLPEDVTCEQCVLQWRYRTGNSWGYENGQQGLGLGQQEEFYGCSDFSVQTDKEYNPSIALTTHDESTASSTTTTTSDSPNLSTSQGQLNTRPSTSIMTSKPIKISSTELSSVRPYPDVNCSKTTLGQPIYRDCHSFYICAYPQFDPFLFGCPQGTVCNPSNGNCDEPANVPSCVDQ